MFNNKKIEKLNKKISDLEYSIKRLEFQLYIVRFPEIESGAKVKFMRETSYCGGKRSFEYMKGICKGVCTQPTYDNPIRVYYVECEGVIYKKSDLLLDK